MESIHLPRFILCLALGGPVIRADPAPADAPPQLLQPVMPDYPANLKAGRVTGRATVSFQVGEDGGVSNVKVDEATHPEFGQAAAEAVRQFKYQPACRNGRPRSVQARMPMEFNFDDAERAEMELHRVKETLPPGPAVVAVSGLDEWPELKDEVRPATPAILKAQGRMGETTVGFVVDEAGIPRDVHLVVTTQAECVAPAMDAVRQWKFSPGQKEGQAVRVALEVPVVFFPETFRRNGARVRPGVVNGIDPEEPGPEVLAGRYQPARAVKKVRPGYPEEMSVGGMGGTVDVEVSIDARGRVTHVCAVNVKNAFFGALAERAVSYWTFSPATRGGVPVSSRMTQPMTFEFID